MQTPTKKLFFPLLLILIFPLITFISCEEGNITAEEYQIQYYREVQLENIYNNEIAPLNSNFIIEINSLKSVINDFNTLSTTENLEILKSHWITVLNVWKRMELYNIGPIADSFIHSQINRWPSNETIITGFINGTEVINEAFIESKGASAKGVSAIEYLLFENDELTTLNSFTTDVNSERRKAYLFALAENLQEKAQLLETYWIEYKASFVSQLENGTDGSQNQIINAMVSQIEEIIISKLGNPLGDNSGGIINPEELEAEKSETSLDIIKQNTIALQRCYSGDFANTPFRVGFENYIIELGYETLNTDIHNRLEACLIAIGNLDNLLKNELAINPGNVTALQNTFTDLLVVIKVDMANAIGSTITFNDNDGD